MHSQKNLSHTERERNRELYLSVSWEWTEKKSAYRIVAVSYSVASSVHQFRTLIYTSIQSIFVAFNIEHSIILTIFFRPFSFSLFLLFLRLWNLCETYRDLNSEAPCMNKKKFCMISTVCFLKIVGNNFKFCFCELPMRQSYVETLGC